MFDKVLVGLELSENSVTIFEQALSLAKPLGAQLMLLHVLTGEDEVMAMPYSGLDYASIVDSEAAVKINRERWESTQHQGLEKLQGCIEQAMAAGVKADCTQVEGNPGRTICALANEWDADLIMVGSHGRVGLRELFLGSVSNYVMHHAACSVLVMHPKLTVA